MHPVFLKLRYVFLPVLLFAIAFVSGYTFLHWWLVVDRQLLDLSDMMADFILPFVLLIPLMFLFVSPRIKRLKLRKEGRADQPFVYFFFTAMAIGGPAIVAQHYVTNAMGKLTKLQRIADINTQPLSKFYTLSNVVLDKTNAGYYASYSTSGKHDETLEFYLHVAVPVLDSISDTLVDKPCIGWLGVKYNEDMSNNASADEKDQEWRAFLKSSEEKFNATQLDRFVYLKRVGNNSDRKEYDSAMLQTSKAKAAGTVVLLPVNEPFEQRAGSTLQWALGTFIAGQLLLLIMMLIPKYRMDADNFIAGQRKKARQETKEFLLAFVPRKGYIITPLVIDANIIVYALMVYRGLGFVSFQSSDLIVWGGQYKPLVQAGEWWRLLTATFLHGGFMHFLQNMIVLFFAGSFLEPYIGTIRFFLLYLVAAICGSLLSLWWHDATVSVGASGAIFGVCSCLLVLILTKRLPPGLKILTWGIVIFMAFNLVIGIFGHTDNAGHIGGIIGGVVMALLFTPTMKRAADVPGEELPLTNIEEAHGGADELL